MGVRFSSDGYSSICFPNGSYYEIERILGNSIFVEFNRELQVFVGDLILGGDYTNIPSTIRGNPLIMLGEYTVSGLRRDFGYFDGGLYGGVIQDTDSNGIWQNYRIYPTPPTSTYGYKVYRANEVRWKLNLFYPSGNLVSSVEFSSIPSIIIETCVHEDDPPDEPKPDTHYDPECDDYICNNLPQLIIMARQSKEILRGLRLR